MSRLHRAINLVAVVVPFLCFIAALVLLWNRLVGWVELSVLVSMYLLTGLGITIGFHRLFTHRSFDTYRPIRYLFAVLGSMAVEGPVITWVADHRKHHAFADEDGDPHSPHTTHGGGTVTDGLLVLLWGGAVRIFLLHHVTWSINSVCHFFGRRRFATEDHSTNVAWLSIVSFGESWHHNHHAFPTSASHGLRRWELALDPGGLLIRTLEKLGLAWNVVKVSPERQQEKLAAA